MIVKIDELSDLVPQKAGATWSALWQVFYYTRLFKYVHKRHYQKIKKSFNKICTHEKLQKLCALGYFKNPQKDIYCATNKVLSILKEAGFIIDTLPYEPIGKGDINELNNTDVFITLMKEPHFFTLLYPNFGYLIPDTLFVQKDQETKKYKLTFIEVEKKKPEWEHWIEEKHNNYKKLSTDINFFNWWSEQAILLGLPKPDISKIFYTYKIIKHGQRDS